MTISTNFLQRLYYRIRNFPIVTHLFQARYDYIFKTKLQANLFRGIYHSMEEAALAAPTTKGLGYDQPGPANMYRDRMIQVFPTDYPILFWLKSLMKPGIRVFDLGGHIGVSFYAYEKYIDFPEDLKWLVCDVPAVTESGKALAKENSKSELSFTNDYCAMGGSDVLFASGSLQYIEKDLADILSKLSMPPSHLLFNLLPIHKDYAYVTLQNIGTAFCPYRIFKENEFIESFTNLGYRLVDKWDNPEKACFIPFHESYSVSPYSGFYFTKYYSGGNHRKHP